MDYGRYREKKVITFFSPNNYKNLLGSRLNDIVFTYELFHFNSCD